MYVRVPLNTPGTRGVFIGPLVAIKDGASNIEEKIHPLDPGIN